jgi:hypothetical protein
MPIMTTQRTAFIFGLTALMLFSLAPVARADSPTNITAALASVGLNVPACKTPTGVAFTGTNKGAVTVSYNSEQKHLKILLSVHDALPNTVYVVDIRCWVFGPQNAIASFVTNGSGAGSTTIDLWMQYTPAMGTGFYVDLAVPSPLGAGDGKYGDTMIAGPFKITKDHDD